MKALVSKFKLDWADFKEGLKVGIAARQGCVMTFSPSIEIEGYLAKVFDEQVVLCGMPTRLPGACVMQGGQIFVNRKFLEMPSWFKKAVLAHERGHYMLGHMVGVKKTFFMKRDWDLEIQADRYSVENGNDMLSALKLLVELYGPSREFTARIKALCVNAGVDVIGD